MQDFVKIRINVSLCEGGLIEVSDRCVVKMRRRRNCNLAENLLAFSLASIKSPLCIVNL